MPVLAHDHQIETHILKTPWKLNGQNFLQEQLALQFFQLQL